MVFNSIVLYSQIVQHTKKGIMQNHWMALDITFIKMQIRATNSQHISLQSQQFIITPQMHREPSKLNILLNKFTFSISLKSCETLSKT